MQPQTFDNRNIYLNSQTFCLLIELGSFSAVARYLSINQSTVSRRIASLEESLDLLLLKRNTRGFIITENGEKYYQFFKQQDNVFSTGIDNFRNYKQTDKITLRIAIPLGICNKIISPMLAKFLQENPQLTLHIFYQNQELDLIQENYDLAIIRHIPKQQTVKIKKLYKSYLNLYCSPQYLHRYGLPNTLEELAKHLVVGGIQDDHDTFSFNTTAYRIEEQTIPLQFKARLLINSLEPALEIAKNGHAIIGGNDFIYTHELGRGELVKLLPDYKFSLIELFLVRINARQHTMLDKLIGFLESCFHNNKVN